MTLPLPPASPSHSHTPTTRQTCHMVIVCVTHFTEKWHDVSQVWKGPCRPWHATGRWLAESQTLPLSIRHYCTEGSIWLIHNYKDIRMSFTCLRGVDAFTKSRRARTKTANITFHHFSRLQSPGGVCKFFSLQIYTRLHIRGWWSGEGSLMILSVSSVAGVWLRPPNVLPGLSLCPARPHLHSYNLI